MACDLNCFKCTYDDCINVGELNNAIYCRKWYEKNKEKKRAYQREYARKKRAEQKLKAVGKDGVKCQEKEIISN